MSHYAILFCEKCERHTKHHRISRGHQKSCDYCGRQTSIYTGPMKSTRLTEEQWANATVLLMRNPEITNRELAALIGTAHATAGLLKRKILPLVVPGNYNATWHKVSS